MTPRPAHCPAVQIPGQAANCTQYLRLALAALNVCTWIILALHTGQQQHRTAATNGAWGPMYTRTSQLGGTHPHAVIQCASSRNGLSSCRGLLTKMPRPTPNVSMWPAGRADPSAGTEQRENRQLAQMLQRTGVWVQRTGVWVPPTSWPAKQGSGCCQLCAPYFTA